jgi:hypothetical protein
MERRMDAIRLKQILGEPLTDRELMCLQIEQNGFGCHACLNEPPPLDGGSFFRLTSLGRKGSLPRRGSHGYADRP